VSALRTDAPADSVPSRERGYGGPVFRWLCALVAGAVVSGFAALLVTGEYANEGPTLLSVSSSHGLHVGDLFVLAGWAVAVLALLTLAAMPGRCAGGHPHRD
jgi:hypothetical protein